MQAQPKPTALLLAALLLTALADVLLRGAAWGINLGLWATAVALAGAGLIGFDATRLARSTQGLAVATVAFALLFSFRDSNALKAANGLAMALCLGAMLLPTLVQSLRESSVGRLLLAPFAGLASLATGVLSLVVEAREERSSSPESKRRGKAALRGLLLALPLLLVFGGLFASADAVFRTEIESLGRFDLDSNALGSLLWTPLVSFPFVGGLLYRLLLGKEAVGFASAARPKGPIGIIEIAIVLASLSVLFGAFLAVQFRYLFGAQDVLQATHGLSYAEYARGGFFQLVGVAALTLAVLVGADGLLKRERPGDDALYRGLGRVLTGMVFLIVASALMRMKLYTDAFGLTELRVYSTVFMGWLALAFGWLLVTTLAGRPQRFAFGMLVSGFCVILGTNLLNPDGLIVRTNLAKPGADFAYLTTLSDDAALEMQSLGDAVPPARRAEIQAFVRRRAVAAAKDWRESNLTRWSLTR